MKKSEPKSYLSKLDACLKKGRRNKKVKKRPSNIIIQTSTFTVDGKTFCTLEQAEEYLQKQQNIEEIAEWLANNSYKAAERMAEYIDAEELVYEFN